MKNYKNFLFSAFLFILLTNNVTGMEETSLSHLSAEELQERLLQVECEMARRDEESETRRQQSFDRMRIDDFPYGQLSPRLIED